jgi:hypothetical protein
MKPAARAPRRPKSSGVAALELALSLVFLVPLLTGMLQFGYYFYVASHAEEAARAGVREAVLRGGNCAGGALVKVQGEAPPGAGTGNACITNGGGAAACYMNEPPLLLGNPSNTNVLLECFTPATPAPNTAPDPTWRITVRVDFQAALGAFKSLLPAGVGGMVRYTATVTSTNAP